MSYSTVILHSLYILLYPIILLLHFIVKVLAVASAPLMHLIRHILGICRLPLTFLGRFEALYIFLGVALLIGLMAGTSLHHISRLLFKALGLDVQGPSKPAIDDVDSPDASVLEGQNHEHEPWQRGGHKPSSEQDSETSNSLRYWSWAGKGGRPRGGPMRDNVILEEDDSSELGF